jgi:hypothetical protein
MKLLNLWGFLARVNSLSSIKALENSFKKEEEIIYNARAKASNTVTKELFNAKSFIHASTKTRKTAFCFSGYLPNIFLISSNSENSLLLILLATIKVQPPRCINGIKRILHVPMQI